MEGTNKKKARKEILAFIEHLQTVEDCLLTTSNNPHDEIKECTNTAERDESCAYLMQNLETVISHFTTFEEHGMFVITILNQIIRIYVKTLDHNVALVIFQSMAQRFINSIVELSTREAKNLFDSTGESSTPGSGSCDENSGEMLESILMNFISDKLLVRCLSKVYGYVPTSHKGNGIYIIQLT
jgi:hypothetical protein